MEIITKKRMMLFTGSIHPALGHEIADNLGIPGRESKLSRFASGEIYFRSEESVRGADVFVVQTHYEPVNEAIMEQLIMIDAHEAGVGEAHHAPSSRTTATRGRTTRRCRASRSAPSSSPTCCRDGRRRPHRLGRPALGADPGVLRLPVRPPDGAADPVAAT